MALGSRQLSNKSAIVSRLAAIEELAGMTMLCSDKTGTLTMNQMALQAHTPVYVVGADQALVLKYAALAAKWLEPPKARMQRPARAAAAIAAPHGTAPHPIAARLTRLPRLPVGGPPRVQDALDTLVLTSADLSALDGFKQTEYVPFDPQTKRTEATIIATDGSCFKARGALRAAPARTTGRLQ